jgi:hypothetical protein
MERSQVRISGVCCHVVSICVAMTMLAACGALPFYSAQGRLSPDDTQPPIGAAGKDGVEQVLSHHLTFRYTGEKQSFKVPVGVSWITVVALGAGGGGAFAGRGGRVSAEIPVMQDERLAVFVGGTTTGASGGYNGGGQGVTENGSTAGYGGGGATDIREDHDRLRDRILVAGGGGGQGGEFPSYENDGRGGKGGGISAGAGRSGYGIDGLGGGGGSGGTQDNGGSGGSAGSGYYGYGQVGLSGSRGEGGSGGIGQNFAGGGGGGGYYGGGGGGGGGWDRGDQIGGGGGGGGGSSYAEPNARKYESRKAWKTATGNGVVTLSW